MTYNLNIPGWMPEYDLKVIEDLANKVPPGGIIVEIGSFAGRSSYAWAKSCDPSVTVYCIDKWDTTAAISQKGLDSIEPKVDGFIPYSKEEFEKYTNDCINIIAIQAKSPFELQYWEKEVDLVFIDDDHLEYEFIENLRFWHNKLKPGGILCGHDFRLSRYWHVIKTLLTFSKEVHTPFIARGYSFIWEMKK